MAGPQEDDAEKEFAPSQRKLQQARETGDVIRSEDIQAAVGLAGFVLSLVTLGPWAVRQTGAAGREFLDGTGWSSAGAEGGSDPEVAGAVLQMVFPSITLLAGPALAVLVWLVASRGFVLAPSKLAPKGSRVSMLANFRQKFGLGGLVDFAKKTAKMLAISGALAWYLQRNSEEIFLAAALDAGQIAGLLTEKLIGFLLLILAMLAVFGLADYLWQWLEFQRRHRMTRKELTDEMKESEGDPQMKAGRRRRAQEIANRKMMAEVPKSDVIIVNPTHYAVALKWDRRKGRAPVCVAKGVDEIAARIRELAQEAGVPIRRDPPTARALHAALEVGDEVHPDHYAAVAAAIRFAEAMRVRARKGWAG